MKCKKKLKALLFIVLTVLIVISSSHLPVMNNLNFRQNVDEIPSTSHEMTEGIFINGSATGVGAPNWTWVQNQTWFGGGTGSWKEPFILEDLIFNLTNEDRTIEIINSDVYVEIRNCSFLENNEDYVFYLINVNNSRIINNDIIFNNPYNYYPSYKIYIQDCYNFSILENDFSQSDGIEIYDCYNFSILENNFSQSEGIEIYDSNMGFIQNNSLDNIEQSDDGLLVSNCDNITISYNSFSAFNRGIRVNFGNNITISNNMIYDCGYLEVELEDCNHVNVIENDLTQNNNGIRISDSDNVKLRKNILKSPNLYEAAIHISNSYNTSIIENEIEDHYIHLYGDENAIFSMKMKENVINGKPLISYAHEKNLVSNNFSKDCEVFLINCSDSSFSDLNTSKGSTGISLYYCTNITMQNITSNENIGVGFHIQESTNITMEGSSFSYNYEAGIYILSSHQVDIINNEINFNLLGGVVLENTDYCLIDNNTIIGNRYYGLQIYSSWYNKIYSNIILENYYGCILQNDVKYNEFFINICDDRREELFSMNPLMSTVVLFILFMGILFLLVIIRDMNNRFKRELKYITEKAKR